MGIWSMGLCIAVMVVAICILVGFKQEISKKVFGFGSHVIIQPYWSGADGNTYLVWDSSFQNFVLSNPQVQSAQPYAQKGALIRGKDESHGVFFKGLPTHYDTSFFAEKLTRGRMPRFQDSDQRPSNQVLVSESLANVLEVDTGSRLRAYFVHEGQLRPRSLQITGIYATGLESFDETYVLGDIGQIRQINGWKGNEAEGIDIQLKDPEKRFDVAYSLGSQLPYEYSCFPCDLLYPEIFDWLALIDTNVLVLMLIMLIVCLICLISILFILSRMDTEDHGRFGRPDTPDFRQTDPPGLRTRLALGQRHSLGVVPAAKIQRANPIGRTRVLPGPCPRSLPLGSYLADQRGRLHFRIPAPAGGILPAQTEKPAQKVNAYILSARCIRLERAIFVKDHYPLYTGIRTRILSDS